VGFKICKECGFVTYDYEEEEKIIKRYNRERPIVNPIDLIYGNKKEKIYESICNDPILGKNPQRVLDYGCGHGYFLNRIKQYGIKVDGYEPNPAFSSWAKNEYKVNIVDKIEKKYSFITMLHVLEHLQNPDKTLEMIVEHLEDNGHVMISVPLMFDSLMESSEPITGRGIGNFEEYYMLNHINVFSRTSLKNLLDKCGLKIIKEDDIKYGYTVICEKKENRSLNLQRQDYKEIIDIITRQRKALEHLFKREFIQAYGLYPDFPAAYIYESQTAENQKDLIAALNILQSGLKNTKDNYLIQRQIARLYFQWDENTPDKQFYSNSIKESERIFVELMASSYDLESCYYHLAFVEGKYKKNYEMAIWYMKQLANLNPSRWAETMSYVAVWVKELK
jgi:SAM-dependent methyltransferase